MTKKKFATDKLMREVEGLQLWSSRETHGAREKHQMWKWKTVALLWGKSAQQMEKRVTDLGHFEVKDHKHGFDFYMTAIKEIILTGAKIKYPPIKDWHLPFLTFLTNNL